MRACIGRRRTSLRSMVCAVAHTLSATAALAKTTNLQETGINPRPRMRVCWLLDRKALQLACMLTQSLAVAKSACHSLSRSLSPRQSFQSKREDAPRSSPTRVPPRTPSIHSCPSEHALLPRKCETLLTFTVSSQPLTPTPTL